MNKDSEIAIKLQAQWTRIILLIILAYEGFGGLVGGFLLIIKPDGTLLKMSSDLLHGSFNSFLVPGITLLVLGFLSFIACYKIFRRERSDWLWSCIILSGWYIWFVVEIFILQELNWQHLIWGVPVLLGIITVLPLIALRKNTSVFYHNLLYCGILSSLWYLFMNLYIPAQYPGYSTNARTVSELSALGSPTRILWVILSTLYPLLYAAFGWAVLFVAGSNKKLKTTALLIIAYSLFNLYWPPMHTREAIAGGEKSITDSLHIAWTIITVILFILTMIFGAMASGKRFRIFTVICAITMILFGILTSQHVPNMEANLPTPSMGLYERISQYVFFSWIIFVSIKLLRKKEDQQNMAF